MIAFTALLSRLAVGLLVVLSLSGFAALEALFAPKAELWERWTAHDPASATVVDHGPWDRFLKRHVRPDADGLNRIDYEAVAKPDRKSLVAYIDTLGAVAVSQLARPEQLAYWLNAYNALTVRLVLDHAPVASIRDIDLGGGGGGGGPWDAKLFAVEGETLSLNDIEHRILRPIWKDPRLHYGVNCASVGCPNLQAEAYTGAWVETMLEDAAMLFVNAPRNVVFSGAKITVSKIYNWFEDDFGGSEKAVLTHLRAYAATELYRKLEPVRGISGYTYDWSLNGPLRQN